jgi:uncharacterized protein YecE (DUF72 family)
MRIRVGTAGWSIPRTSAHRFVQEGTHLHRYARYFSCAEINSSFHRPHTPVTYAKWAASTPDDFCFAVKLPRAITHEQQLRRAQPLLESFLAHSSGLGHKRGPLLVQLPPSSAYEPRVAARFFQLMRKQYSGPIVCEPRHPTWFTVPAEALLVRHEIARVAADPPPVPGADRPGGWGGLVYYRLHGSPRKYWSRYDGHFIRTLAEALARERNAWCVFDNTASGSALENAWETVAAIAVVPEAGTRSSDTDRSRAPRSGLRQSPRR